MARRRKLEEEIARTKDLVIRKQLQELLDKREERRDKTINDAKEIGASVLNEVGVGSGAFAVVMGGAIVVLLIVYFFMWIFGAWATL
jgi:preprotein translocase subunit SecF